MPDGGTSAVNAGPAPRLPLQVKRELAKGQGVSTAVQKSAYFNVLAANREITAQHVATLTTAVADLLLVGGQLAEKKVAKLGQTLSEQVALTALKPLIAEIQKAAHQKFQYTDKIHLKLYQFKLSGVRKDIEDYTNTALIEAGKDGLPGITPAKLVAAAQARREYVNSGVAENAVIGEGQTVRALLETLRKRILEARGVIQYAADAEWPHTDPANVGVRKEFLLPPKSRFKG